MTPAAWGADFEGCWGFAMFGFQRRPGLIAAALGVDINDQELDAARLERQVAVGYGEDSPPSRRALELHPSTVANQLDIGRSVLEAARCGSLLQVRFAREDLEPSRCEQDRSFAWCEPLRYSLEEGLNPLTIGA